MWRARHAVRGGVCALRCRPGSSPLASPAVARRPSFGTLGAPLASGDRSPRRSERRHTAALSLARGRLTEHPAARVNLREALGTPAARGASRGAAPGAGAPGTSPRPRPARSRRASSRCLIARPARRETADRRRSGTRRPAPPAPPPVSRTRLVRSRTQGLGHSSGAVAAREAGTSVSMDIQRVLHASRIGSIRPLDHRVPAANDCGEIRSC